MFAAILIVFFLPWLTAARSSRSAKGMLFKAAIASLP